MLAKTGPGTKVSLRPFAVSLNTSVPVMSAGIRSGVNCTLENSSFRMCEIDFTNKVLANPGAPVMRQ